MKVCVCDCLVIVITNIPPDQPLGSQRRRQVQKQRYPPPVHRRQLRIKSHFVRGFSITRYLGSPLSRSGASLTLAHGRRYGLIGRNGKSQHSYFTNIFYQVMFGHQVLVNQLSCDT